MPKIAALDANQFISSFRKQVFDEPWVPFNDKALRLFAFQYTCNPVYRRFCELTNRSPQTVKQLSDIPFLPISAFKTQDVGLIANADIVFESSGTTGSNISRHAVQDLSLYEESFMKAFSMFYGSPGSYCIIGLLPSYLERQHSSLVFMVDQLIRESAQPGSGFYLDEFEKLHDLLLQNEAAGIKTLLIGVTFALLDFAEAFPMKLSQTIVMETGGMKGRKKEITREEVHAVLSTRLGCSNIHSEYGMTELLSQAYASSDGLLSCPPWMKIGIRSDDDPFDVCFDHNIAEDIKQGAVNIIDLANMNSCAFIATDDLGKLYPDGRFNILGRLDNSDIRGCSLMLGG